MLLLLNMEADRPRDRAGAPDNDDCERASLEASERMMPSETPDDGAHDAAAKLPTKSLNEPKEAAKKKRRRRRGEVKKKDPLAPRRPLSAYNLFFRDQRNILVSAIQAAGSGAGALADAGLEPCGDYDKQGGRHFASIGKTIAKRWKELSPDAMSKYSAQAAKEKERYKKEMTVYREKELRGELPSMEEREQAALGNKKRKPDAAQPDRKPAAKKSATNKRSYKTVEDSGLNDREEAALQLGMASGLGAGFQGASAASTRNRGMHNSPSLPKQQLDRQHAGAVGERGGAKVVPGRERNNDIGAQQELAAEASGQAFPLQLDRQQIVGSKRQQAPQQQLPVAALVAQHQQREAQLLSLLRQQRLQQQAPLLLTSGVPVAGTALALAAAGSPLQQMPASSMQRMERDSPSLSESNQGHQRIQSQLGASALLTTQREQLLLHQDQATRSNVRQGYPQLLQTQYLGGQGRQQQELLLGGAAGAPGVPLTSRLSVDPNEQQLRLQCQQRQQQQQQNVLLLLRPQNRQPQGSLLDVRNQLITSTPQPHGFAPTPLVPVPASTAVLLPPERATARESPSLLQAGRVAGFATGGQSGQDPLVQALLQKQQMQTRQNMSLQLHPASRAAGGALPQFGAMAPAFAGASVDQASAPSGDHEKLDAATAEEMRLHKNL